MHSYILPAHKDKITFITAGDLNYWYPQNSDLESLRNIIYEENLSVEQISELLIVTHVQEFHKLELKEEYVFVFSSHNELFYDERKNLQRILKESIGDDTMKIFMGPGLKVKRIKKSLLPFI